MTSRWPIAFFLMASIYIIIGTCWGLYMSITHQFETAPAHAHLNLLGWVSLSIMGAFYAFVGKNTPRWLMMTNFFLNNVGVVLMIIALALLFTGKAPIEKLAPILIVAEPAIILGFVSFFAAVVIALVGRKPALAAA